MIRFITTIITVIIIVITAISCGSNKAQLTSAESTKVSGTTITVQSSKMSNNGIVYYSLYNSNESFINKTPLQYKMSKVTNGEARVVFTDIPKGTYAVLCFQDLNGNKRLDFEGYMPTEPYGMSNNPQLMGPPRFDLLKFEVETTNIILDLEM